jgi:hypothetical protein
MSLLRHIPSGSFDPKKRIIQNMQAAQVNDQIFEIAAKLFENAVNAENIVLARSEKTPFVTAGSEINPDQYAQKT